MYFYLQQRKRLIYITDMSTVLQDFTKFITIRNETQRGAAIRGNITASLLANHPTKCNSSKSPFIIPTTTTAS